MTSQDETALLTETIVTKRRKSRGFWAEALRDLVLHRKSGQVGLVIIGLLILMALLAPSLATHNPNGVLIGKEQGVKRRQGPCIAAVDKLPSLPVVDFFRCNPGQPEHFFGTDGNGRDLFSRVLYGSRVSLKAGIYTVFLAVIVGMLLGAIAGYIGAWVDNGIMRILDVVLAFPSLILAIAINSALLTLADDSFLSRGLNVMQRAFGFEDIGLLTALISIAIVSIPTYAAPGARPGALVEGAGVCHGGPRDRRPGEPDPVPGHPAQRNRAADCGGDIGRCDGHPRHGGALLPGPGRAAAHG